MAKEENKIDKKKIAIIILGLLCFTLFIVNFDIPIPFRYEIKGTSQGYIYKIDRFTGKTWIVSKSGEKEIKNEELPEERQEFPINLLEISEIKAEDTSTGIKLSGTIKNTSGLEATEIWLRADFSKDKGGESFHYEVFYPFQTLEERVQPGSSKTFTKWVNWQTYQAVSPYKNWYFTIYPKEAKIY
jgi:hypothetical protein